MPRTHFVLRAVLLAFAVIAACIVIFVAAVVIGWWHENPANAQRLKVLQADGVLHCQVAGITPWHEQEEMNADLAGTTRGIGWGGRAQTMVTRLYSLNDADPASVTSAFTTCAQANGWTVDQHFYVGTPTPLSGTARVSGIKSFPGGWTARLTVYVTKRDLAYGQPMVQLDLRAEPI